MSTEHRLVGGTYEFRLLGNVFVFYYKRFQYVLQCELDRKENRRVRLSIWDFKLLQGYGVSPGVLLAISITKLVIMGRGNLVLSINFINAMDQGL